MPLSYKKKITKRQKIAEPFLYLQKISWNMMYVVILSVVLLAIAVLLMAVKIIFVKGGKFPSHHAHDSEALRKKGVKCASKQFE